MKRTNQMIKKLSVAAFTMVALAGFGLSSASANGFDVVDENSTWPVAENAILSQTVETQEIYADENGVWPVAEENTLSAPAKANSGLLVESEEEYIYGI